MMLRGYSGQPVHNSLESIVMANKYKDLIRYIAPPQKSFDLPQEDFEGAWKVSSPENAFFFSATGFYFAKNLVESLDVPVGIVVCSWGGSRIESWIDEQTASKIKGLDIANSKSQDDPKKKLGAMYNSLFNPVKNYTYKGIVWYQGESNIENYKIYPHLQSEMVNLWRKNLKQDNIPFYYVQIAPYAYANNKNGISAAQLVEAQIEALKLIPNSGIIPTTDIGSESCIHPPQKDVVGFRLANLALSQTYGYRHIPSTGPIVKEIKFVGNKAIISFSNAEVGLTSKCKAVKGFELAGDDNKFYEAEACINTQNTQEVIVTSTMVNMPKVVRYAFCNYPEGASLYNTFGLPAFPFRSDKYSQY
jgi:sialate O-acetylesterase